MTWQTVSLEMRKEILLSRILLDHLAREKSFILSQNHEKRIGIKSEIEREEVAVEIPFLHEQLEALRQKIHVQIQHNGALLSVKPRIPSFFAPKALSVTTLE
ncbi:hypothetical protein ACTFIV_006940 [Dictyostelium citrinum]